MKEFKYITVLNFEIGKVFQYEIGVNDIKGDERLKNGTLIVNHVKNLSLIKVIT